MCPSSSRSSNVGKTCVIYRSTGKGTVTYHSTTSPGPPRLLTRVGMEIRLFPFQWLIMNSVWISCQGFEDCRFCYRRSESYCFRVDSLYTCNSLGWRVSVNLVTGSLWGIDELTSWSVSTSYLRRRRTLKTTRPPPSTLYYPSPVLFRTFLKSMQNNQLLPWKLFCE